jgi:hypothetical protein
MEHFRNSIMFRVSVPVLSENTYSICPKSSLRSDVLALAYFCSPSSVTNFMLSSFSIIFACVTLIMSSDTYSEMGTRLLYRIKNVKKDTTMSEISTSCTMEASFRSDFSPKCPQRRAEQRKYHLCNCAKVPPESCDLSFGPNAEQNRRHHAQDELRDKNQENTSIHHLVHIAL